LSSNLEVRIGRATERSESQAAVEPSLRDRRSQPLAAALQRLDIVLARNLLELSRSATAVSTRPCSNSSKLGGNAPRRQMG